MNIRPAVLNDLERIYEIWRDCKDPALAYEASELEFFRARLALGEPNFPFWIYETDERIIGWACLSPMRTNPVIWETMAELSFYVSRDCFGQGTAGRLLKQAVNFATNETSIEWVHAWVSVKNEPSIKAIKRIGGSYQTTLSPVNRKPTRDTIALYSIPVTGLSEMLNPVEE
jgi:L-amino acid N-acyltransferase YncA